MKTLKILGWYYLAGLICILEFLMFCSIILIPLVFYLIETYWWWAEAFEEAKRKAQEIRGN